MKKHQKGWRLADALLVTFVAVGLACAAIEIAMACSSLSLHRDATEVWP
jgi:hypothetical protein